jgi:hypothetical protein
MSHALKSITRKKIFLIFSTLRNAGGRHSDGEKMIAGRKMHTNVSQRKQ